MAHKRLSLYEHIRRCVRIEGKLYLGGEYIREQFTEPLLNLGLTSCNVKNKLNCG